MMEKKIRVLHVVTIMNLGGIETFLMTLYRNIDRTKIQFDFLVHRTEVGFFDKEVKMLGGRIFHASAMNPKNYFKYKKELESFLRNSDYKIIHSHLNANSSVVLGAAKKIGIPIRISHSHIDKTTNGLKGLIKNFNKIFINKVSTNRFACSEKAGAWLFGKQGDFTVFNNSIDTSRFKFDLSTREKLRDELSISQDCLLIGNVARFNYQKNHNFQIDVFYELLKIQKNAKLLLIGEGELQDEIKNKVKHLGIEDSVIFTGAIGNANDYFNAMDIFLFPSKFEGLGIVGIEAQANGLPVLMNDQLPPELNQTDLVYRLSLEAPLNLWVKQIQIIQNLNINRSIYSDQLLEKGYDIKKNAEYLENFYLKANDNIIDS